MFLLKTPQATKSLIWLVYTCADGRLRMSLGLQVDVDKWNADTRRVNGKSTINPILSRIEAHIVELEEQRRRTGQLIKMGQLRSQVMAMMGIPTRQTNSADLLVYFHRLVAARKSGAQLTRSHKRFSASTLKHYRHTLTYLHAYVADTGQPILSDSIGMAWHQRFVSWCQQPARNLATNSIGVFIKHIKAVMQQAWEDGLHRNAAYQARDFRQPKEQTPDIYLTEAELEAIRQLPDATAGEAIARDWFLIECYTGLRVSDATRLTDANFQDGRISISNEKTDEKVVLPIHPVVQSILASRGGLPPAMSSQKINKHIKELGRRAGIVQQVLYSLTKGGVRVDEYLPKYAMISNHTGRRSFITNLVRQGVNYQIIMKLAGIRKAATLDRYNKLSVEETADVAANLPFFSK